MTADPALSPSSSHQSQLSPGSTDRTMDALSRGNAFLVAKPLAFLSLGDEPRKVVYGPRLSHEDFCDGASATEASVVSTRKTNVS
jgi:hypothetical protein